MAQGRKGSGQKRSKATTESLQKGREYRLGRRNVPPDKIPWKLEREKKLFQQLYSDGAIGRAFDEICAHKAGYHRNYIGQLERGEKSPSLSALFTFAAAFGIKPSQLLKRLEALL